MSKALFGAMAMFYAVGAGAGGGLTPPASLIGAAPQLNFSDIANTGGYLMNTAGAGTILSDGSYYNGSGYIATDSATVGLQMNGALGGFILYANPSTTPGSPFSPSYVLDYLGGAAPLNVTPILAANAGMYVAGGAAPAAAVDALAIYYAGAQANIVARTFPSGTYQAINVQTADFLMQVHNGAAISAWEFASGGNVVHTHAAQSGAAEVFYDMSAADDATALLRFKNNSATNGVFVPALFTTGSTTNISMAYNHTITTDTGTNPVLQYAFNVGGSNVTTRPLVTWGSIGANLLQLIPLGTGNNAALSFGTLTTGAPAFTTRSVGTRLVLFSQIDATHVDYAVGVENSYTWISSPASSSTTGVKIYAGTTLTHTFRGDGVIDATGGIYCTGNSTPSAGQHAVMQISAGAAIFAGFNYTGSVYLPSSLQGSTVSLSPSGTAAFTADTNRCTFASGIARHVTVSTAAGPVTMAATDDVFAANPTTSAATTYKLPAVPTTGEVHTLVDMKGIAAGNTLTLDGNGKTINGAATQTITNAFGSLTVVYNGTEWNITAKF